jgi:hypothetical protein
MTVSATNMLTLAQLDKMDAKALEGVPTDQIVALLEVATCKADQYKGRLAKLNGAIAARYKDAATAERRAAGKDTGTVHVIDGEWDIEADAPKKVEWDQAALATAFFTLRDEWKENPLEYMKVTYGVDERKYTAWPAMIRKLFDAARTVSTGTHKFTVKPAKREVA